MSIPATDAPASDERVKSALTESAEHYRAGRLPEAERVCRDFLAQSGGNGHIWNTLGVVLRAQRRASEAVQAYRESLRILPDNASAWSNLANALNELEQLDEAAAAGRQALVLDPDNTTYRSNLDGVMEKIRKRDRTGSDRRGPAIPARKGRRRTRPRHHPPKVLFISHEASRTGAPSLLLSFLRWLKANTDISIEILVKGRTDRTAELKETLELIPEFEKLGPTMRWYKRIDDRHDAANVNRVKHHVANANYDLVFANTICNGDALGVLGGIVNCPIISYIHELEFSIRCNPARHVANVLRYTTRIVAGSHVVKQNLAQQFNISEEGIEVVPSFIDIAAHKPTFASDEIRRQLGIPPHAFVVNACATAEWRKGTEIFIMLANAVRRRSKDWPLYFVWVGDPHARNFFPIHYDIKRMGLGNAVQFIGARPNFRDYIAAADVFAMVSREDPFPLVVLEAALLQRPIVCFDKAGGSGEFVEQDCGFVLPYLDIEAMAERIIELAGSKPLRDAMGRRAAAKVRERHDAAVGSAQLWSIMSKVLNPEQADAR